MSPARLVVLALGALLGSTAAPLEPPAPDRAGSSSAQVLLAAATLPSEGVDGLVLGGAPMLPSHVQALETQPAQASHDAVVAGLFPRPEDLATVLPPPPQRVKLENSYGTVTVTHAAHLARRIACKSCHGSGPIQKIGRFQPKEAHDTCRACHVKVARGPTDCRGCHVKNPDPAALAAAAEAKKASVAEAPPKKEPTSFAYVLPGAQPAAFDPTAAAASFETAVAWRATQTGPSGATVGPASEPSGTGGATVASGSETGGSGGLAEIAPPPARRKVFAGTSILAATGASPAAGISLGVTFEQEGWQFSDILEWAGGGGSRRALGLVAAGVVMPLRERWTAHVLGVGGFDATDGKWTSFLPALGARAGFGYATGRAYLQSLDFSVTALADAMRSRDPRGASMSGALISVSLSAELDLNARR